MKLAAGGGTVKDDITLRDVLDAVPHGYTAIEQKIATKDDIADLRTELNPPSSFFERAIKTVGLANRAI
jgi:hypothetical protein